MSEDAPASYPCPDCGETMSTQRGLSQHRAKVHGVFSATSSRQREVGRERSAGAAPPRPRPELSEREQTELRDRLIGHFAMIGGFLAAIAPHTGLTLVSRAVDRELEIKGPDGQSLSDPEGRTLTVRRRGIATILLDYGRRDHRIMRGLLAFDRLMEAGDEVELVASLAAAVAVDTGRVDPHEGIGLPGTPIRIAPDLLIGDVIAQVEEVFAAQAAAVEALPHVGGSEPEAGSENVHETAPDGMAAVAVPSGRDTG